MSEALAEIAERMFLTIKVGLLSRPTVTPVKAKILKTMLTPPDKKTIGIDLAPTLAIQSKQEILFRSLELIPPVQQSS